MPCMCGDLCCWSCGPAQGNFRCIICNEWASEGCEHLDEDGNILPEHKAEADRRLAEERERDAAEAEWERRWLEDHPEDAI